MTDKGEREEDKEDNNEIQLLTFNIAFDRSSFWNRSRPLFSVRVIRLL